MEEEKIYYTKILFEGTSPANNWNIMVNTISKELSFETLKGRVEKKKSSKILPRN